VEAAGEVPFEAAERSLLGLALRLLARQIRPRVGVVAGAADRDDVQRVVEPAVAAAVEPVPPALACGAGDGRGAGLAGEAGVASEPLGAGGAADRDGGGQWAAAGLGEQLRTMRLDQGEQLAPERVDLADRQPDLPDLLARDPDPGADRRAAQASIDPVEPPRLIQRAPPQ